MLRPSLAALAISLGVLLAGPVLQCYAPGPRPPANARADRLELLAAERLLIASSGGEEIVRYRVSLGPDAQNPKVREGDGRTPHGSYVIDQANEHSAYHLALHISYPDGRDRARAGEMGVSPGGDIMIHGLPGSLSWLGPLQGLHRMLDWTQGCIAVTDREMEELWRMVPMGTPILLGTGRDDI